MGKKLPCSINVGKKIEKTDTLLKHGTFWDMKILSPKIFKTSKILKIQPFYKNKGFNQKSIHDTLQNPLNNKASPKMKRLRLFIND